MRINIKNNENYNKKKSFIVINNETMHTKKS